MLSSPVGLARARGLRGQSIKGVEEEVEAEKEEVRSNIQASGILTSRAG